MTERTLRRDDLAVGGVRPERRQQVDVAVADVEQDRLDSLRLDRLAMSEFHFERALVELDRLVEVFDCDSDVVYPGEDRGLSLSGGG